MTLNELKELDLLRRELVDLKNRRQRTKGHPYAVVHGSRSEFPYTPTTFIVSGAEKYADDTRRLQDACAKKIAKKISEIEQWIASVDSSYIRQIIKLKYVDGLTWPAVSMRMGTHGDGTTERNALVRYCEKLSRLSRKKHV